MSGLLIAGVQIARSEPPSEGSSKRALVVGFRYTLATPLALTALLARTLLGGGESPSRRPAATTHRADVDIPEALPAGASPAHS